MRLENLLSLFSEKTECSIYVDKKHGERILPGDIVFNGTIGKIIQIFDKGKYIAYNYRAYKERLIISTYTDDHADGEQLPTLSTLIDEKLLDRPMQPSQIKIAIRGTERDKMPPEIFPYKEITDKNEIRELAPRCVVNDIFIWQNAFYIHATKTD